MLVALQPLETVDQQRQASGRQLAPRGERSRHAGVGRLDELVVVEESRGQGEQRTWGGACRVVRRMPRGEGGASRLHGGKGGAAGQGGCSRVVEAGGA